MLYLYGRNRYVTHRDQPNNIRTSLTITHTLVPRGPTIPAKIVWPRETGRRVQAAELAESHPEHQN